MKQITTKQALDIIINNKGTTMYITKNGFNKLTNDMIDIHINNKRSELCDYMLYDFKAYKNGYERIHYYINECIETLDDYIIYSYENKYATMLFLTNDSNTVIINTFYK